MARTAAAGRPKREAGRAMRLVALVTVVIGLAALTAAACVLSYSSIHHLAIQAGVSGRLASIYPLIFDALLVLAGCSVLALRGAGLASRVYGWLCLLVLLVGLAAGGAVHAAAIKIPHRPADVTAAVVPWVLVLIGFGLLLALLRHARIRRLGQQHANSATGGPAADAAAVDGTASGDQAAEPSAVSGVPVRTWPLSSAGAPEADPIEQAGIAAGEKATGGAAARQADLQLRARIPRQQADDLAEENPLPGSAGRPAPVMPPVGHQPPGGLDPRHAAEEPVATDESAAAGQPGSELSPAPTPDSAGEEASGPPAFRRTRSSPTPPGE